MAYGVANIDKVEAWTAASYAADDGSLDLDVTTCFTNGTDDEACDEWKEGTINGRIEMDIDPASLITLSIRFFLNSIMNGGDSSILPYTDINSVSTTNEVTKSYDTPEIGTWVEHILSAAFIAEMGEVSPGKCAVRWASNDGAKSKLGECNIDFTIKTYTVAGITRDEGGTALVSVEYQIEKRTGLAPSTWNLSKSGISNGSTGAYTEQLGRGTYRIVGGKDVTPQVMDINPPIILAEAATDDIFTLGKFSSLANDDVIHVYQAGGAALPIGTGFAVDTDLHVVQLSGDTIKLALTQGGSAINITTGGDCIIVGEPETS